MKKSYKNLSYKELEAERAKLRKELVDRYDAVNRKFCAERKLDYVDILSRMRAEKDLKSLYVSDGVHLSPEGGRLIADTLLKYFASQFK